MADLASRLKQALDETRMLMLGTQVLIGFQYEAVLERSFDRLAPSDQWLMVTGLGLQLCTMAFLFAPAMFHQIAEGGAVTANALGAATTYATIALLPFAVALGLSVYIAASQVWARTLGVVAGMGAFLTAASFWYGLELWARRRTVPSPRRRGDEVRASVKDRIDHVLTEARTILPGAQALLGFQFIAVFMQGFESLPPSSKSVHVASLACIALSTILLLTPAAYHRIVERGEDTEEFHRLASRLLIAATIPLALGVAGDVFVVVRKVSGSVAGSAGAAATVAVVCFALWYGLSLVARYRAGARRPWPRRIA
jgi:hypothetical protein